MTQLTEHAKNILRAIADEKQLQRMENDESWKDVDTDLIFRGFFYEGNWNNFRIKPETRSINGKEFAAPVQPSGNGFTTHHLCALAGFGWPEAEDRDTAYRAIIDALEGAKT